MSLTPEQIAELQAKAARVDELEQRLNAVDSKKGEILDEKKQLQAQLGTLQAQLDEMQAKLQAKDKGDPKEVAALKQVVEQLQNETKTLREELNNQKTTAEEAERQRIASRVQADFVSTFAGKVRAPSQLLKVLSVQDDGGTTVAEYQGRKVAVSELPALLAADPEYSWHFLPGGEPRRGGMGIRPSTAGVADASTNPWKTGNVTEQIAIRSQNPDLADKLKAEASAARNSAG